jgi:hypothetical protein
MEASRVSPRVFRAIQTVDVDALESCSDIELRPGKNAVIWSVPLNLQS